MFSKRQKSLPLFSFLAYKRQRIVDTTQTELATCTACGKMKKPRRITLKLLFSDVINVLFNFEKGFLYTIRELLLRPGKTVGSFLDGSNRYRLYNPFRFAFVAISLSILLYILTDLYEQAMLLVNVHADEAEQSLNIVQKYGSLISLALIPFIALGSWLFFRRINYAEHIVANFFVFGQVSILGLLLIPVYFFVPELILQQQPIGTLILFIYLLIFFQDYFKNPFWMTLLKTLGTLVVGTLSFGLVAIGITVLVRIITGEPS